MCVISGFCRGVNEICTLLAFAQILLVVTDVSGQPAGPFFKGNFLLLP